MAGDEVLEAVRARYVEVNGEHPMSQADDEYVRAEFVEATDEQLEDMLAGVLPLPSYLLSDGTPMVPADHATVVEWAGGKDRVHDWWLTHWPAEEQDTAEEEWHAYLSGQYVCLVSANPTSIRDKTRAIEQIRTATAALEVDPRDPVARGSLDEAVRQLDRLERQMTDYDRLRFDGPTSRDVWIDDVRERHLTPEPPELPLRTERLVLRRRTPDDVEATHALHGDPEVTRYLLHRPWTLPETRHRMLQWYDDTSRGLALGIDLDGRLVGETVLLHRGPSVAEIGWILHPDVQGRGVAYEAAREMLRVGFEHYGFHRIYAELDARNGPSARLAERLGMRREAHRLRDFWSQGEWTDTPHYAVLATEWSPLRA